MPAFPAALLAVRHNREVRRHDRQNLALRRVLYLGESMSYRADLGHDLDDVIPAVIDGGQPVLLGEH